MLSALSKKKKTKQREKTIYFNVSFFLGHEEKSLFNRPWEVHSTYFVPFFFCLHGLYICYIFMTHYVIGSEFL